ncbi:bifunctional phosphopantothenoylcysteine decarboxylase/phosphopantothenate--cysteine ligase CoaBC [Faecalicatena contorta]|uniref:Coenzyme A biosynthesis bifunctional protein CoaBC n=1 Tax=Faecalicatena fissicatena TaxID=290055 RepID=A0ABS2EAF9_9FIRM|nr:MULTISPECIES: bifunctional phosphopantothenoylcysteine decarboxylase/phosphopantothenate--cysteine ligase CoaBC [Faecalicatena]MBM6685864.1 bifunctional phosphopantothenoylcysteine decarboxylase/phosphopantothenate--cysteine ligase CoaBC [Faecalicatena contorta]MBM6711332.1 bifunctional phosphopantothenoylcysteine decarboxylase/phosphopantothenate--cysteine ligase CoaBC [Faecalicatena contorta]MBM6738637.1 bifunctional phosphopantothenoylcysteine decarboxylase/phosphopantothenate--cysteine li
MLKGKTVILGVTGGIAAYKSAYLTSLLIKAGADVQVIMTDHAREFISPLTFEGLTNQRCHTDTFDRNHEYSTEHVSLASRADAVIIAPATANVIAKLACGIADDMLTTTVLACDCPKIVVPAMNTRMYDNPVTQDNLEKLRKYGMTVVEPAAGRLACGDVGKGKMPEPDVLFQYVLMACAFPKDMEGKKVLVTAGPTQERIDPVRYITNHSTGRMGYSIAKICALRGAKVTLVTGQTALEPPLFVDVVPVVSARDMYEAVVARSGDMDVVIKAAAVADYRPAVTSDEKIKKSDGDLAIAMERTDDILGYLGQHKRPGQFLCGFSMETQNMLENSRAKLARKNLDMIVANNLKVQGAGFGTDTNVVTIITADMEKELELMSKDEVAVRLLDEILARI